MNTFLNNNRWCYGIVSSKIELMKEDIDAFVMLSSSIYCRERNKMKALCVVAVIEV